jgi:hypothetical protein
MSIIKGEFVTKQFESRGINSKLSMCEEEFILSVSRFYFLTRLSSSKFSPYLSPMFLMVGKKREDNESLT